MQRVTIFPKHSSWLALLAAVHIGGCDLAPPAETPRTPKIEIYGEADRACAHTPAGSSLLECTNYSGQLLWGAEAACIISITRDATASVCTVACTAQGSPNHVVALGDLTFLTLVDGVPTQVGTEDRSATMAGTTWCNAAPKSQPRTGQK